MSETDGPARVPGSIWEQAAQLIRNALKLGDSAKLREDLEATLEEDQEAEDGFSASERTMMRNILRFSEIKVEDVMVPRADIIAVEDTVSLTELLRTFRMAGHSRLPVFHETLDDPRGFIHIKDLLGWLMDKSGAGQAEQDSEEATDFSAIGFSDPISALDINRPILYVPPSMLVADLLLKMQSGRLHLAIVVDEYGGTDGLVSIEDLVEEIVGEIEDEHDVIDGPMIREEAANVYMADARTPIEDLEQLVGMDLLPDERDEDTDTLGGLISSLAGRIPVRGELISHQSGLEFEVLEGDLRRIKCVRVRITKRPGRAGSSAPKPAQPVIEPSADTPDAVSAASSAKNDD